MSSMFWWMFDNLILWHHGITVNLKLFCVECMKYSVPHFHFHDRRWEEKLAFKLLDFIIIQSLIRLHHFPLQVWRSGGNQLLCPLVSTTHPQSCYLMGTAIDLTYKRCLNIFHWQTADHLHSLFINIICNDDTFFFYYKCLIDRTTCEWVSANYSSY